MHSILAMTPHEIDAMIQRVQGGYILMNDVGVNKELEFLFI